MQEDSCQFSGVPEGTIHSTISLLQSALIRLDAPLEDDVVEHIGILVQQAMSMQNRSFHTPEHIFDLVEDDEPHFSLAAVFHDLVYYQVDNGFHSEIEELLRPYLDITADKISIKNEINPSNRAFWGTAAVFGFSPGQVLSPFAGLNEFLSALFMNTLLEGKVKDTDLLIATAAIEMTIPFRGPDKDGRTPAQLLELRIRKTSEQFGLGLGDEEIINTVKAAVTLSNRDIRNFAEVETARFLDNTWKLLPETNPELFFRGLYTIGSYAAALRKMEGFLSFLKPENIFQQYAGYPDEKTYKELLSRTKTNLIMASRYLGIKMLSAAILQALAELTGGDVPISFFMGDIMPGKEWCRLTYYLPESENRRENETEDRNSLYSLLKYGRAKSTDFDLQNSPLSAFIYCSMDDENEKKYVDASRSYLNKELTPDAYLQLIPAYIVEKIAHAASVIAFTRRTKLEKISESFKISH